MPGFYPVEEYDLAGFSVGLVDRSRILDPETMQAGDAILALPSTGVHSNGFSLVRKVFDLEGADLHRYCDELGMELGEALLVPTAIYVKPLLALAAQIPVRAAAHITGGGFYENIPRALPKTLSAKIEKSAVRIHPLFHRIQQAGNIPERDMFNTYNMGVGMAVVVPADQADQALAVLQAAGQDAYCPVSYTHLRDDIVLDLDIDAHDIAAFGVAHLAHAVRVVQLPDVPGVGDMIHDSVSYTHLLLVIRVFPEIPC